MKKVLFVLINMNLGGTEKSFLNLVDQLPKDKYEISLLLLEKKGELLHQIPSHIKVLELKEYAEVKSNLSNNPYKQLKDLMKKRSWMEAFFFMVTYSYRKITKDSRLFYKYLIKNVPVLNERYDLAIAYAGPMDFITYYTNHRVKAEEKIQWIHFDITRIGFDTNFAKKMYRNFNKIYVVSKHAGGKLIEVIPALKNKVEVHENIISAAKIQEMALREKVINYPGIKIVTVARLTSEKAPERALKVCKHLIERGHKITWHWIGDGPLRDHMNQKIKEYGLTEIFILEGARLNPYPYVHEADIYVQPSDHEGYCITIAEAKVLNKPIVTTATAGAVGQITHDKTGLITKIDDLSLLVGIERMLADSSLRHSFTQALSEEQEKLTYKRGFLNEITLK